MLVLPLLRRGSGAGQDQLPFVPSLGLSAGSYQLIADLHDLQLVAASGRLGRDYAVKQGWLQLVPSLESFSGHPGASQYWP